MKGAIKLPITVLLTVCPNCGHDQLAGMNPFELRDLQPFCPKCKVPVIVTIKKEAILV